MFAYTAFVIDAFANRILGWECSTSKHTRFVEAAIRQAAAARVREGHLDGRTGDPSQRCRCPIHVGASDRAHSPLHGIGALDRHRRRLPLNRLIPLSLLVTDTP